MNGFSELIGSKPLWSISRSPEHICTQHSVGQFRVKSKNLSKVKNNQIQE